MKQKLILEGRVYFDILEVISEGGIYPTELIRRLKKQRAIVYRQVNTLKSLGLIKETKLKKLNKTIYAINYEKLIELLIPESKKLQKEFSSNKYVVILFENILQNNDFQTLSELFISLKHSFALNIEEMKRTERNFDIKDHKEYRTFKRFVWLMKEKENIHEPFFLIFKDILYEASKH